MTLKYQELTEHVSFKEMFENKSRNNLISEKGNQIDKIAFVSFLKAKYNQTTLGYCRLLNTDMNGVYML